MAAAVRSSSSTATATPSMPTGAANGDLIVVLAYAGASATAPTLATSWTAINNTTATPALRAAYRVYDGVWTMGAFTNATTCHAVAITGRDTTTAIGAQNTVQGTIQNIVWAALATQQSNGASLIIRAAAHTRPDQVIATAAGHTLLQAAGTQPGFISQYIAGVTTDTGATSNTARSTTYSATQFEVRGAAGVTQKSIRTMMGVGA